MNERVHFVWTQFSELNSYHKKQADDEERLNVKLAELLSLVTCDTKSVSKKRNSPKICVEQREILARIDSRIDSLYASLPTNAMLIICTGHGDIALVQRYVLNASEIRYQFHLVLYVLTAFEYQC